MEINNPLDRPKHNPVLMSLSNVIIFGAAYLVLHLYARFFIVYGLMFIFIFLSSLVNISSLGLISAGLSTLLSIGLLIFVIIDTHIQTKNIVDGKRVVPIKKKGLTILGVTTIIAFIIAYLGMKVFIDLSTPRGPFGESQLQNMQRYNEEDKKTKALLTKYPQKSDAHCESFRSDPSLTVGSYRGQYIFVHNCYLKKAIETNDPSYCGGFEIGTRYDVDCISALAIKNKKPELCTEMLALGDNSCSFNYEYRGLRLEDPCGNNMPENMQQRCKSEFGDFFAKLQLK